MRAVSAQVGTITSGAAWGFSGQYWRSVSAMCGEIVITCRALRTARRLNQRHSREMGERGREAVARQFNWTHEERKLVSLYREALA